MSGVSRATFDLDQKIDGTPCELQIPALILRFHRNALIAFVFVVFGNAFNCCLLNLGPKNRIGLSRSTSTRTPVQVKIRRGLHVLAEFTDELLTFIGFIYIADVALAYTPCAARVASELLSKVVFDD